MQPSGDRRRLRCRARGRRLRGGRWGLHAGDAIMRRDFLRSNDLRIDRDFIELSLEVGEIVAASAEEDGAAGAEGRLRVRRDFRIRLSVEINVNTIGVADEDDVVPSPW